MEDKVKLNVLGISYSPVQTGAFAMLLAEENGPRRIPVVIGSSEAQSIALKLEGVVTPRPMTHDLFVTFSHAYGVELKEVFIYKFEDGIFSAEMVFTDGDKEVSIDARTSDAVAIAVRTSSPIYTTKAILDEVGTVFDERAEEQFQTNSSEKDSAGKPNTASNPESMSDAELQDCLNRLIDEENYEEAAKISEILKKRNSQ